MKPKKLQLDRETVAPMSPSDLHRVHGGVRGDDSGCIPDPMRTRLFCPQSQGGDGNRTRQFISCTTPTLR